MSTAESDPLRPRSDIYDVFLGGEDPSQIRQRWIKVGIGFLNPDRSIHIVLDALPVNGKLYLRERLQSLTSKRSPV